MAEAIDLRGTQGAVVLPNGTVVQHYPAAETDMNQRTDNGDRAMYDQVYKHTDQLADIRARVTIIEATLAEIKGLLQRQQPGVSMTMQQLLMAVMVAVMVAALIFGVSYAGQ